MGLEAGSAGSRAHLAGIWPGMGSLCYCWVALAWGRKSSTCWLIPLSQELRELSDWQAHNTHGPQTKGPRRCPACWSLQLLLPVWLRGCRSFLDPQWSPYHFLKGCCGFFGIRLSVAWTSLNAAQWAWAPALAHPKLWSWCWSRLWHGAQLYFRYRALWTCLCASRLREELPREWPVKNSFCFRLLKVLLENFVSQLKWVKMICLGWM